MRTHATLAKVGDDGGRTKPSRVVKTLKMLLLVPIAHAVFAAAPPQTLLDAALSCTRCVSSAHTAKLQSSGAVVLRQALQGDAASSDRGVALAAAALAARLLDVPACREAASPTDASIGILCATSVAPESFGLHPGDVLAVSSGTSLAQQVEEQSWATSWFSPADANDEAALWCDPFYGTRGSAPTTVIEWSKGTIHHATKDPQRL